MDLLDLGDLDFALGDSFPPPTFKAVKVNIISIFIFVIKFIKHVLNKSI